MPAEFTATAGQLTSVAAFLNALNLATEEHEGTLIGGTFTIRLPDTGSFIDACYDDALGQYVLSDMVGGS